MKSAYADYCSQIGEDIEGVFSFEDWTQTGESTVRVLASSAVNGTDHPSTHPGISGSQLRAVLSSAVGAPPILVCKQQCAHGGFLPI